MLPVRIGMNSAVILLALLLAVPLQLFFSHYISKSYEDVQTASQDGVGGDGGREEVIGVKTEAMNMLGKAVESLMEQISYYSTLSNLKELFTVPFKKKGRSSIKVKAVKSEKGFTTIVLEDEAGRDKTSQSNSDKSPIKTKLQAQAKTKSKPTETAVKPEEVKEQPTSSAKEVKEYLFNEVYFGQSKEPRSVKPSHVTLSVGQVIRHKQEGYYGVIIGWDAVAKASEEWIERYYGSSSRQHIVDSPHYLILVDSHFDASAVPFHYLPQDDIEVITSIQIQCLELSNYFESYRGGRHIPRPWLRKVYPRDG